MDHHHLAVVFGILGNIVSFVVFLAPVPTFRRIYQRKSTEGFDSLPYLVALFSSMLWLYYGLIKTNSILLISINSFGCAIEIIYCFMYITYATRDARKLTIKIFATMNVGSLALIFLITRFAVHESHRVQIVGWICVAISVSVFVAPLSIVVKVIQTKSVQYMPFNLSFFLTLSAIVWFAHGYFKHDVCIYIPNVFGFALGVIQISLYAYYSFYGSVAKEKENEPVIENIVIVTPLGSCEVFPIPLKENDDIINDVTNQQFHGNKLVVEDAKEEHEKNGETIEILEHMV